MCCFSQSSLPKKRQPKCAINIADSQAHWSVISFTTPLSGLSNYSLPFMVNGRKDLGAGYFNYETCYLCTSSSPILPGQQDVGCEPQGTVVAKRIAMIYTSSLQSWGPGFAFRKFWILIVPPATAVNLDSQNMVFLQPQIRLTHMVTFQWLETTRAQ